MNTDLATKDCPTEDQLVAMVEGALDQESLSLIEQHVDNCEACAAVLAGLGGLEQSQVRRTLGRYQLDRRIAAGGMGEVWAAWDPQLRRELAIKFVRPDRADEGRERDRLLREARAMARLTHPNVLAVHDVGEIDGEVFLVTELVVGDTLATRGGPSSDWRALVRLYIQAARGLAAAHAAGLVHRDVKPANLLIGGDGRVRVADFGLAVRSATPNPLAPTEMPSPSASSVITAAGHIAGTPAYMAPEQRAGQIVEAPADQFALCVALGEGIAGRRPPTAPEKDALRSFIAERRTIDTDLDALCDALARGLALDPAERFPSMTALADALEAIVGPAPELIGSQPSGGHRSFPSGGHRAVSGGFRTVSGQQRALSSAPDLDRNVTESRRPGPARLIAVLVAAGVIGAGVLYLATRGSGSSSANTPVATGSDLAGSGTSAGSAAGPAAGSAAGSGIGTTGIGSAGSSTSGDKTVARPQTDSDSPGATDDDDEPDDEIGPGKPGKPIDPNAPVTLRMITRAIGRRDPSCRVGLAHLKTPPPTDFRVASAHALCEMLAGNCEGGEKEQRALNVREGSDPDTARIEVDLYCPVEVGDQDTRLRRLMKQISMFTDYECSYYLPASRAAGKAARNDEDRREVGIALSDIAKCYSWREDCTTGRKLLAEAQAYIPALRLDELAPACR